MPQIKAGTQASLMSSGDIVGEQYLNPVLTRSIIVFFRLQSDRNCYVSAQTSVEVVYRFGCPELADNSLHRSILAFLYAF